MPDEEQSTASGVERRERALARHRWQPGQSGNPGGQPQWRKALIAVVGNGERYWELLAQVANAQEIQVLGTDGSPSYVLKPTLKDVLKALEMLADRAYGKPVQALVTAEIDPTTEATEALRGAMEALEPGEREMLAGIARRLALAAGQDRELLRRRIPQEMSEAGAGCEIDVTPLSQVSDEDDRAAQGDTGARGGESG